MPTTSPEPESTHAAYWLKKLTLPVDDPFWNYHHPGDRWNCKCSLEATDEPVNRPDDMEPTKPQRGLENNPGKDGHTFSDKHPYFPSDCSHCFAYKKGGFRNSIKALFLNREKDCYNCPFINGCIERPTAKQPIEAAAFARKEIVNQNDLMPKSDKEPCATIWAGILNRTNKVRNTFLKHCHHDYDVDAAVHIWNNPTDMRFVRVSPLGERKNMSLPENQANIEKKRSVLHFVEFHQYEFDYHGRTFEVKLALCERGVWAILLTQGEIKKVPNLKPRQPIWAKGTLQIYTFIFQITIKTWEKLSFYSKTGSSTSDRSKPSRRLSSSQTSNAESSLSSTSTESQPSSPWRTFTSSSERSRSSIVTMPTTSVKWHSSPLCLSNANGCKKHRKTGRQG